MSKNLAFGVKSIDVKKQFEEISKQFELVISLHCKQLFPSSMLQKVRCINVHPGLNPYNRGWFPQVFSILNGMPAGATIHEIDQWLDHGNIIAQEEVEIFRWDTSKSVYDRVQHAEIRLLRKYLRSIIDNTYSSTPPLLEGNVNLHKDYRKICKLDLDEKMTLSEALDKLRALSHEPYQNAFFIDPDTKRKVFVSVNLHPESTKK